MSPRVLKAIAAAVVAAIAALEQAEVAPAGLSGALGAALTYAVGLYHPTPARKGPEA